MEFKVWVYEEDCYSGEWYEICEDSVMLKEDSIAELQRVLQELDKTYHGLARFDEDGTIRVEQL